MLSKEHRLRAGRDFRLIYERTRRTGRKFVTPNFLVRAVQTRPRNPEQALAEPARFGFSASERIGGAVIRNRARRRLREAVRASMAEEAGRWEAASGWDFVITVREGAARADFSNLVRGMAQAVKFFCQAEKRDKTQASRSRREAGR